MYVDLQLEHSGFRPRRVSGERSGGRQDRSAANLVHRLFLVLLIVALVSVLVLQVMGPS